MWDATLSFQPFLKARLGAARAAFKPLCALVREGTAPLEEVRLVMQSTVEGTLFYGAMFMFMAEGVCQAVTDLQYEFERSLIGLGSWTSHAAIRCVAGWSMDWGTRLFYEVLVFRAELWCTTDELLVHEVWVAAQHMPGKTFASASSNLLQAIGFVEICDFANWKANGSGNGKMLGTYKTALKHFLHKKSCNEWALQMSTSSAAQPHLQAVKSPVSVGGRLLDAGKIGMLYDAAKFDRLRLGVPAISLAIPTSRVRRCTLCADTECGLAHVLATCSVTGELREKFFASVDNSWKESLQSALAGDWPTVVLSPHQSLDRLVACVTFGAAVVDLVERC